MNNYQVKTLKEMLKSINLKCSKCESDMFPMRNRWAVGSRKVFPLQETLVGYSCENCSHYYLFDDDPV